MVTFAHVMFFDLLIKNIGLSVIGKNVIIHLISNYIVYHIKILGVNIVVILPSNSVMMIIVNGALINHLLHIQQVKFGIQQKMVKLDPEMFLNHLEPITNLNVTIQSVFMNFQ